MKNYIIRTHQHIHGENFFMEDDARQTALETAVLQAGNAKRRRECNHNFGIWERFNSNGPEQRTCRSCRHTEYR